VVALTEVENTQTHTHTRVFLTRGGSSSSGLQWHAQLRGASPPHAPAAAAGVLGGCGDVISWTGSVRSGACAEAREGGVRLAPATQAQLLRHPAEGLAAGGGAPALASEGYGPALSRAALLESPSTTGRGSGGNLRGVRSPAPF
jgi:hypothetical protein